MPYRTLDAARLVERIETLRHRIEERFEERGLAQVCRELESIARDTHDRVGRIQDPILWLRFAVGSLVVLFVAVSALTVRALQVEAGGAVNLFDLMQTLDAVTNEVILIGAALVFLVRTERRVKQQRTLKALHELRSLAHVIDEHQLDKDPDRILGGSTPTASSPRVVLTPHEMLRYLNYCSEMLSAIGKLAALYVQYFDDDVAVAAVTEVEELTLGLSRKIWQKIMIIHQDPRYRELVAGDVRAS